MIKRGDKVLFSSCPKMGIPYKEYIVRTDEVIDKGFGCNSVFLEGYSGKVDASFCKIIT